MALSTGQRFFTGPHFVPILLWPDMLFNSFDFLLFFPVVYLLFRLTPDRHRWVLLLAASYYFYMSWKAEYLVLILVSTAIDYLVALFMEKAESPMRRKALLITSIAANLGILFTFKYANFFGESFNFIADQYNLTWHFPALNVLLPVGISFYTFQSLSYSVDVYRGERAAERHLGRFALYVAFFPQLVAGPIERSTRLLPQFYRRFQFSESEFVLGLRLMLWGFFKKLVIADRLAIYVNEAFANPAEVHGVALLLATYFFAFQIYCDFSGYSDIAIGTAKILGYDLMDNFRQPYFSRSIGEFWRRWHISLSTWFRDYLYIPLGGNRGSRAFWFRNLMIVFVVSGLWHGANWTFVIWGALHGAYMVFGVMSKSWRSNLASRLGLVRHGALLTILQVIFTFHLVCFAWIFFRAESLRDALLVLYKIALIPRENFSLADLNIALGWGELGIVLVAIAAMELVHWIEATGRSGLFFHQRPRSWRWSLYLAALMSIAFFGVFSHSEFIYFQF